MYAIIATGGKQYKVAEGDIINVEKLGVAAGEAVTFDQVLAVNNGELASRMPNRSRVQPYPLQLLKKAKQRKLSFTSTRENLDTIRKMVTDSSTHRLRSRRSTHNYD